MATEVKVVTRRVAPTHRRVQVGVDGEGQPVFETQAFDTPEQLTAQLQTAVDNGWSLVGLAGLGAGGVIAVLTKEV